MNFKLVKALFLLSITTAAPVFCNEQRALKNTSVSAQQIKPSFVDGVKKALADKAKAIQKYVTENKKKSAFAALVCTYCIAFYNREKIFLYAAEHESRVGYNLVKYMLYLPRGVRTDGTSKFSDRVREINLERDEHGKVVEQRAYHPCFSTSWMSGGNEMNFADRALFVAASHNNIRAFDFIDLQENPSDRAKANLLRHTASDAALNDINKKLAKPWIEAGQLNNFGIDAGGVPCTIQCAGLGQNIDFVKYLAEHGLQCGVRDNGWTSPWMRRNILDPQGNDLFYKPFVAIAKNDSKKS